jgi:predicted kinase
MILPWLGEGGARLEMIDLDTPLEECIRRDALREKPVGEAVIRGMYERYLAPGELGKDGV